MSENSSSLQSSAYRPDFSDAFWISETIAGETEALTRALQISLSDDSSGVSPLPSSESLSATNFSFLFDLPKPEPAVSSSDPESGSNRVPNRVQFSPARKITKRKARVSKRSPITFITADPSNFRQMVQQVTGIRFGSSEGPVEPVFKPEPQRAGNGRVGLPQGWLPTLDTSAFLLDRAEVVEIGSGTYGSFGPVVEGTGFDFEPLPSYPTLESWGVM